jgi:hypothetical protein
MDYNNGGFVITMMSMNDKVFYLDCGSLFGLRQVGMREDLTRTLCCRFG